MALNDTVILLEFLSSQVQNESFHREQNYGRGEGAGRTQGEGSMEICTLTWKRDSQSDFAALLCDLKPGLCDNLEGEVEREAREGGDIYQHITTIILQLPINKEKMSLAKLKSRCSQDWLPADARG